MKIFQLDIYFLVSCYLVKKTNIPQIFSIVALITYFGNSLVIVNHDLIIIYCSFIFYSFQI